MACARPQAIRLRPTPPVPAQGLLDGYTFRRWDDEGGEFTLRLDETGLVLGVFSDRREGLPVYMSEVSDIRTGKYAFQPKDQKIIDAMTNMAGVTSFDDIAVTVVYGTNMVDTKYLNLAATSQEGCASFVEEASKLLCNVVGHNVSEEIMLRREYARLCVLRDPKKDGISTKHLQAVFELKGKDEYWSAVRNKWKDIGKKDYIPYDEFTYAAFVELYDMLVPSDYISDVLSQMGAKTKPFVSAADFCTYLNEKHRDPRLNEILFRHLKEEDARQMIAAVEPNENQAHHGRMTEQGLRNFLRSKENAIVHLSRFSLHQDMDQPLCHYYINSSHNTYLTGHQLSGRATCEIYRQVLLSGCRCIELDCWDGTDGEPVITHGNTLVNKIPFKDVVEAINESAFKTSDFPVILSFENHCRFRQQRRMVHYLRTIFTDKLILEPLEDYPIERGKPLPPPSRLRGKIICKNKLLVPRIERGKDDDGMGTLPRHSGTAREEILAPSLLLRTGGVDDDDTMSSEPRKSPTKGESSAATTSPMKERSQPNSLPEAAPTLDSPAPTSDAAPTLDTGESSAPDGGRSEPADPVKNVESDSIVADTLKMPSNAVPVRQPAERQLSSDSGFSNTSSAMERPANNTQSPVSAPAEDQQSATTGESDASSGTAAAASEGGVTRGGANEPMQTSISVSADQPQSTEWSELDMPSLVNYAEPIKFKSFPESEENNKHYQMSSFPETAGVRLVLDFPKEFVKYTQRQNTRIYPKGTRVDSSNYQPQVFWNTGCQMVSLNFQTLDLPMQLNLGKFDYNGMCGYLLKPEVMRHSDRDFDPFAESPIANVVAATMKVQVKAAHMIPGKDPIRVEVDMYSIPADTVRKRFKTRSENNDVTVKFKAHSFEFKKVILPDLAMLRFAVVDSQGTLVGMRVLPLDGLEPGFRYVHLNNERNQSLPLASLFVNIEVSEYIPEEMASFALGLMDPIKYLKERNQAALSAMMDDDDIEEGANDASPAKRPSDAMVNGGAAPAAKPLTQPSNVPRKSLPAMTPLSSQLSPASLSPAGSGSGGTGRASSLVPTSSAAMQVSAALSPKKLSLGLPSVASGRDLLEHKDMAKMLSKINKDISAIRKKFMKSQASLAKAHAAEVKKQVGKAGAAAGAGSQPPKALLQAHSQEITKLAIKSIDEEEACMLKHLPPFFAAMRKTMVARHAAEVKQFEDGFKKEVARVTESSQKENAQKSQTYKEEQKKKVTDKEELNRKIREYRLRLVDLGVSVRQEAERMRIDKFGELEKFQHDAQADLKAASELEVETFKNAYGELHDMCTNHGAEEYTKIALADQGLVFKSLND